jgi:hypothetical protein
MLRCGIDNIEQPPYSVAHRRMHIAFIDVSAHTKRKQKTKCANRDTFLQHRRAGEQVQHIAVLACFARLLGPSTIPRRIGGTHR